MFFRNVMLVLGFVLLLGGVVAVGYLWLAAPAAPVEEVKPEPQIARISVLAAARDITAGTALQPGDFAWKEIAPAELRPGNIVKGQASEADFNGAVAKRDFASGEALISGDLMKHDKHVLAAALKPGGRAISIPLDPSQSAYAMIEPGNHVDVILTQNLNEQQGDSKRKVVAETILQNIRVIAIDQAMSFKAGPSLGALAGQALGEARAPKSVTLELTERQAETLFVALQLGKLQLSLRSLDDDKGEAKAWADQQGAPTWAGDVSPALKEIVPQMPATPSASSVESAVRRPPSGAILR